MIFGRFRPGGPITAPPPEPPEKGRHIYVATYPVGDVCVYCGCPEQSHSESQRAGRLPGTGPTPLERRLEPYHTDAA